jgi:hypothetical protein
MTTRYISPHPQVTPFEREVLTILMEECAEVIRSCSKILRFGKQDHNPNASTNYTNIIDLSLEVGDLEYMLSLAKQEQLINYSYKLLGRRRKKERLAIYMQTEKLSG